jgi:hypothetical protein
VVTAVPNGTGTTSAWVLEDKDLGTGNSATASFNLIYGTDVRLTSGIRGAGTYLPMTFYTGGSERMRIDTSGNVIVTNAAGLGYGTGAGGTVTQSTSKSTAVTLNKPCGQITMNNAALAANTNVNFVLNCSVAATSDIIVINHQSGAAAYGTYDVSARVSGAGFVTVSVYNKTAGSLSEAIILNFAVIKGATS